MVTLFSCHGNIIFSQLQLEEHGIVTALVELMKDVDPEEGLCHLILETLAAVMSGDNVDFSWLYTLGKLPYEHLLYS